MALDLGSTIHTDGPPGRSNYIWGTCPECGRETEIYETGAGRVAAATR